MAKAESFKNQPWATFSRQPYSILTDDYVHEKLLTGKVAMKNQANTSAINIKQVIARKGDITEVNGQIKYWFQTPEKKSVYTKFKKDYLKLHYDNGVVVSDNGAKYGWYGSFQSNRKMERNTWKLGFHRFSSTWGENFRLQYDQLGNYISLANKGYYHSNDWSFQHYKVYQFTKKVLSKGGILLSKMHNNNRFSMKLDQSAWNDQPLKQWNQLFDTIAFNYVKTSSNVTYAIEANTKLNKLMKNNFTSWNVIFGAETQQGDATIRGKISNALSAALAVKHRMGSYGTYTFGIELSQIGSKNTINYGLQLDLNL